MVPIESGPLVGNAVDGDGPQSDEPHHGDATPRPWNKRCWCPCRGHLSPGGRPDPPPGPAHHLLRARGGMRRPAVCVLSRHCRRDNFLEVIRPVTVAVSVIRPVSG